MANEQEINLLDTQTHGKALAKSSNQPIIAVTFLGSNNSAYVRESNVIPFCENYDKYTKKKKKGGVVFSTGLEEADALVLRKFHADVNHCLHCSRNAVDQEAHCERCLVPIHLSCMSKYEGGTEMRFDTHTSWYCSECTIDAPLSMKSHRDQVLKDIKKNEKLSSGRKRDQPTNTKSPVAKKSLRGVEDDGHDNFCFVCNDPGDIVLCDFPGCGRCYHGFCLFGTDTIDFNGSFYCPWHCCAKCGLLEEPCNPPVTMPTSAAVASLKVPQMEAGVVESSQRAFVRCVSCPTSYCMSHIGISDETVFDGRRSVKPNGMSRPCKKGYFKCEHCFGISIEGKEVKSPRVDLARLLVLAISKVMNQHDLICEIFMNPVDASCIPLSSQETWKKVLRDSNVINLTDVREKVWDMRYSTLAEFRKDVLHCGGIVDAVFGGSSEIIRQTVCTLELILDQGLKPILSNIQDAESCLATFPQNQPGGSLYPSVRTYSSRFNGNAGNNPCSRTKDFWEQYIECAGSKSKHHLLRSDQVDQHYQDGRLAPRDEARGISAALTMAVRAVGDIECELPPSRQVLEEMFETQSNLLRCALRGQAQLRNAMDRTVKSYDDIPDGQTISLGEMRVAAEYKLANQLLKRKLADMTTLVSIERQARAECEEKLNSIQDQK